MGFDKEWREVTKNTPAFQSGTQTFQSATPGSAGVRDEEDRV